METRPLGNIKYLVVHHSATSEFATKESIRSIHLNKGYSDIGYHYFISQEHGSPELIVGRDDHFNGAHTLPDKIKGKKYWIDNWNAIGLCIIGNFEKKEISHELANEAAYAIMLLCNKYKIPIDKDHVVGHREVSQTACPGVNTMGIIWKIINKKLKEKKNMPFSKSSAEEIPVKHGLIVDLIRLIMALATLVFMNESDGNGAAKKAEVIIMIKEVLADAGINIPGFLNKYIDVVISIAIDAIVKVFNKKGIF